MFRKRILANLIAITIFLSFAAALKFVSHFITYACSSQKEINIIAEVTMPNTSTNSNATKQPDLKIYTTTDINFENVLEAIEETHPSIELAITQPDDTYFVELQTEPATAEIIEEPSDNSIVEETFSEQTFIEKYPEVPLYNQLDYGSTRYGDSTVRSSGCGIASYAMVLTYLLDREIKPDELAAMYHRYKVDGGSSHCLFTNTTNDWGVTVENVYWEEAWIQGKVMKSLANGQVIIANVHSDSVFTSKGHFIVLYGLNSEGRILVRDPNGANYTSSNKILSDGFENGFAPSYFRKISANYFIYGKKDIEAIENSSEA